MRKRIFKLVNGYTIVIKLGYILLAGLFYISMRNSQHAGLDYYAGVAMASMIFCLFSSVHIGGIDGSTYNFDNCISFVFGDRIEDDEEYEEAEEEQPEEV